jgi:hypothetical protein
MTDSTRRAVLGGIGAATTTLSTGCLGLDLFGGGSSVTLDSPTATVNSYLDLLPTLYSDTDAWIQRAEALFHPQSTFMDGIEEDARWFTATYDADKTVSERSVNVAARGLTETQIRALDLTRIEGSVSELAGDGSALVDCAYKLASEGGSPAGIDEELEPNRSRFLLATDGGDWKIADLIRVSVPRP